VMTEKMESLWKIKLAAMLHDPPEKALVIGRRAHEKGTVWRMLEHLGLQDLAGRAGPIARADWWASAADRPQWPGEVRVDWLDQPVLVHPLSGHSIDLREHGALKDLDLEDIERRSFDMCRALVDRAGDDPRSKCLAFWRFGPELPRVVGETDDGQRLGALWGLLPADTRVPDHAVWEHLDLVSAFTGAFAADPDGEAALLALSIGPVQPFIAAARTTSDLWAGSHLLSRLAWEAMRPVAEALGPDAILFPRLRGVPQVDLWLREQGLRDELFKGCGWKHRATDANPLFAAALPNRFVAVVPASRARELAGRCRDAVRGWLQGKGQEVVDRLLREAGKEDLVGDDSVPAYRQMREQLEGFPEVHWAAVPFSLIRASADGKQVDDAQPALSAAMAPFFGAKEGEPCGFLASPAWQVLSRAIDWEPGVRFFVPNPGVLYPAVSDLAERVLAAAKAVRPFGQLRQHGWRESLGGETEWLRERDETETGEKLWRVPPGERRPRREGEKPAVETLWTRIARMRPSWARKGEHLGGLSAVKRLWPTLFAEEVADALGLERDQVPRFVVSTHTMALAHQLGAWIERGGLTAEGFADAVREAGAGWTVLPRRLVTEHRDRTDRAIEDARRLVDLLECAQEDKENDARAARWRDVVRGSLRRGLDNPRLGIETYYGLLLMDGDRMGAILSGEEEGSGDEPPAITYLESFHPRVRGKFEERMQGDERLRRYAHQRRAVSPGRHVAVSAALNDFALHVAPHVVEVERLGKLIYAGGDDVLALLPVADLVPAAARLRDAYSGRDGVAAGEAALRLRNGYALLRERTGERLMRMMGARATASAGLVVAHHQTPLSRVLREARAAEKAAKDAGRDRCAIRVLKRSGGALEVVLAWDEVPLLEETRDFLAEEGVSRRAVYNTLGWLRDLPPPEDDGAMLAELLAYQLRRQAQAKEQKARAGGLAERIAPLALRRREREGGALAWLREFLSVAEFLARETRTVGMDVDGRQARAAGNG